MSNAIEKAVQDGVIQLQPDPNEQETLWENIDRRVNLFLQPVDGRVTLFLGSAISSRKPAKLPMWNKFIELLWISLLKYAISDMPNQEELNVEFTRFFDAVIRSNEVPNYMITEIIARRLGKQYLDLLQAFTAQKHADGSWAVNHLHQWVAKTLAEGSISAVITTNFDDYLEKAIEGTGAPYYFVTGNPHKDGPEILQRSRDNQTPFQLVIIVSGAKAFSFARSLMPQVGHGKMTFLFKLHGSCYEPESCIDTRLQRSQGLPAYLTDVLDTLLQRTVWFVSGFSGSDMNDNLDYLRLITNKLHARVVWEQFPGGYVEKAVRILLKTMDRDPTSPRGLTLLYGRYSGERIVASDVFPLFDDKVDAWASKFGSDWCKLIIMDLMMFIEMRLQKPAPRELLTALNRGFGVPRQDWNEILRNMNLEGYESQVVVAKTCWETAEQLAVILDYGPDMIQTESKSLVTKLNDLLERLNQHQVHLQGDTLVNGNRQHAQTWVISCLCGLLLLCGGQGQAALREFDMSSNTAWMVGDFETHELLRDVTSKIVLEPVPSLSRAQTGDMTNLNEPSPFVAFISELDNVNAKMNRFGIPPGHYIRALLNRSILFSDGFAVPPHILTNSSVFVSEILFHGDRENYNELLLQYLFPLMPRRFENVENKLQAYRNSRAKNFVRESIDENHMKKLDEYFSIPANAERFIYYDEDDLSRSYGACIRKEVDSSHFEATLNHLTQLWAYAESGGWWNEEKASPEDLLITARESANTLLRCLQQLVRWLPDRVTRSIMYIFADLMGPASNPENVIGGLREGISPSEARELLLAREEIIDKPWVYGPFCRELFDAPYNINMSFQVASRSANGSFVFLEQDQVPSWKFVSSLRHDDANPVLITTPNVSKGEDETNCSSLLFSQATDSSLIENRERLGPIREKIARGEALTENDGKKIKSTMRIFMRSTLEVEIGRLESPAILTLEQREQAKRLLKHCVFLIRRGQPLDRMYEESQLSVPGVAFLRRA